MGRKGPVPEEDYTIPFGKADVKREGSDVTVVALAWLVHEALAAAEELAKEGISVEVVDPRTLVPLDTETIRNSVRKTGRLVIADEAGPTCRLLGGGCGGCHRGCRDVRAPEGPGEAGLRLAGADPLQPGAGKRCLPGPQSDHRRGSARCSRDGDPPRREDSATAAHP